MNNYGPILENFPECLINNDRVAIWLDCNAFDWFFKHEIDLCSEFTDSFFDVCITKQVSFELSKIPETHIGLRRYIESKLDVCVKIRTFFGFHDRRFSEQQQRNGGFSSRFKQNPYAGFFVKKSQSEFRNNLTKRYPNSQNIEQIKKSGMMPNETDIDLAIHSMNAIVLTNDCKMGPLKLARQHNYFVIFLNEYDFKIGLSHYISNELSKMIMSKMDQ